MSEPSKSKQTKSASPTKSSDSKAATSSDTASTPTGSGGGKSSRESVGGASAVHYGFFSNIKSPEYKSGWDEIWGEKKSKKKTAAKTMTSTRTTQKAAKKKTPVVVNLSLTDLPDDVQQALAAAARAKLKKSRVSYDNRHKAGAVSWHIECEVKR